ncbi:ATP-binding protein [Maliponia aquimaris]|uniref:ATP-binding protein n=1 Tax=Maliponia aquimaris TaxID=1673631 RepID=UPI0015957DC6|nr:ATP-binding protein [Maliponia aquimaris]
MAALVLCHVPTGALAERPALVVGWTPMPGPMQESTDGKKTGYMLDLAQMIAAEVQFRLRFVLYDTVPELLAAQAEGRSEMLPGIADLPSLRATWHYSRSVGRVAVHLTRLGTASPAAWDGKLRGLRLAAVRGAPGSEIVGPLLMNDVIAFSSLEDALDALLSNGVDGLVAPIDFAGSVLWAGAVDGQIVVAGPPYTIVHADGEVSGFVAEVLRDLAERSGVPPEFVAITSEEWLASLQAGSYDLLPLENYNTGRVRPVEVGLPLLTTPYALFHSESADLPKDWRAVRLGVVSSDLPIDPPQPYDDAALVIHDTTEDKLGALLSGQVAAVLHERHSLRHWAAVPGGDDRIDEIGAPVFHRERAVAARLDLVETIARLNAVAPGSLASPRYHGLRATWLAPSSGWMTSGLSHVLGALGAGLVLLSGVLLWRHHMRRLHHARRDIAEDLIDKIPLGLVLLGDDGRIRYVNAETATTKAHTGGLLRVGELYETALRDLVATRPVALNGLTPEDWIAGQMDDIRIDGCTREIRLDNGTTFLRTTKLLKDGDTLLLRRDVTEERARLHQIEMLNDHLHGQIHRARAATEDLRSFAYATSHDLKAPTSTALMIADALREDLQGALDPEQAELLADLRVTLKGMSGLIDDIQSYTNALAEDMSDEVVDLGIEVRTVISDLSQTVQQGNATLSVGPLPCIRGSPGQIRTLLANLLDNAIKFRAGDRRPDVSLGAVEAPRGFVGFSVSDNGIGIDPAFHERIFQVFQRLNPVGACSGTGLGLTICQRIAINHGGRITVDSCPGTGSTFTVYLRKDSH